MFPKGINFSALDMKKNTNEYLTNITVIDIITVQTGTYGITVSEKNRRSAPERTTQGKIRVVRNKTMSLER